ncbi:MULTISPECIES: glycosyltransferase family 4 protein [unclassified Paenibacillus]|uniref:glycosyltransferase family 4 protein n=1 Tax=unclassified Paenibacillus TaxID=185978 RepID=UPI0024049E72|nr:MULTISPECIES: glycosyltransferase family 4 protein [unclassified Paenibacillus]MDF9840212.1 glycosyltransferase involved in cell wall biosynthesis [Paenibacillus sp. PastF-2]MDF9846794.1 glycosyltransferase involved in cell wall biosynthesis [Paenibacillus sp. PastM-2]MDF9852857.1 glycosyltransferase involved in cell wall biosynthesis [Paenibacillus sp. PastF-1]MDH6478638.1 glycosyltransferase involved in cell wall biosynthesis [Paenibacillus sp. PastH-2]MDH6505864.1 glycosyltransferase inv
MESRVYQIIEALDYGDAVSTHCIELKNILSGAEIVNDIFSKYVNEKMENFRKPISELKVSKQDVLIFHYSGKSSLINTIKALNCKKILIYHNITPHHYFEGMEPHYTHCLEGRKQLSQLRGMFDLYLGDSEYNVQELDEIGCSPTGVLPIVVDMAIKNNKKVRTKNEQDEIKFIFVGRVAPNKKHEDIIRIFEYYHTYINPNSKLYLVGNYNDYSLYYNQLMMLVQTMVSKNSIQFTGKISEGELDYHYRTADIFLSMSEHEGFCVPLLESMSYGVPTFAFDAGAIRTTLGKAGVLITSKDYDYIGELIHLILNNQALREEIINNQYDWINNFSIEATEDALLKYIDKVRI